MSRDQAERAVIISALVVGIVYAYRRLEEPTSSGVTLPRLIGAGAPAGFAPWVTAWGTVFFMLAIASEFAPGPAGAFAILVATSDVLTNGAALFTDLGTQTNPKPAAKPKGK